MKKLLIAAAAMMAGTAALSQVAPAPPAPPAHPMADKVTTRDEAVAMVRDHFARLDDNKDGAITTAEVKQRHGKWAERRMEMDGAPGGTWRGAPMGDPSAAFDRIDANKDGAISRDEFAKGREQRFERRIVMSEKRKDTAKRVKRHHHREFRMHHMGGMAGAHMIVMADTNKDGQITLAEAEAKALEHFDKMDINRDGRVTPEERRAAHPVIMHMKDKRTAG